MAVSIQTPLDRETVSTLHSGDQVRVNGRVFTARDAVHKYLAAGNELPVSLEGNILYHCGPLTVCSNGEQTLRAAGPTTSSREEPYMADIIRNFGVRAVIGKGGMGEATLQACRECGCVYLHTVGGAAQLLADAIVRVCNVFLTERFPRPEAVWEVEVKDFPAFVTMDAHGNNIHEHVREYSEQKLSALLEGRSEKSPG